MIDDIARKSTEAVCPRTYWVAINPVVPISYRCKNHSVVIGIGQRIQWQDRFLSAELFKSIREIL